MKKLVGILAVSLATTLSALAEEPRFQELSVRLCLTPEQAEQVQPVLAALPRIMKAVRDDYGVRNPTRRDRSRMERELRAIRSHADGRLKRILSRAQMEELKKIRREWRDDFQGGVTPLRSSRRAFPPSASCASCSSSRASRRSSRS